MKSRIQKNKGQAALEVLLVLGLFLAVIFFFMSSIFFLTGRVLAQGTLDKAVKEVASLGCVPTLTNRGLQSGPVQDIPYNEWLAERVDVFGNRVVRNVGGDLEISWRYNGGLNKVPFCNAALEPSGGVKIDPVPSDELITVELTYQQAFPLFDLLLGSSSDITLKSSMVSSSLEKL